jgi:3-hydroxy-3-methylglutaryl CoA synthase
MADTGISSYGVYIPSGRMERSAIAAAHAWAMPSLRGLAKGQKAFCSWDEDSITMAVEAARGCLKGRQEPPKSVTFASTTPVFSDLQNAGVVAGALRLENVSTLDVGGSLRAGTSALIRAFGSAQAQDDETLVIAADNREARPASVQEMQYGAGSIALGVCAGEGIAKFIGSESTVAQFVDHFRAEGQKFDYHWEERWVRNEGYLKIIPPVVDRLLQRQGIEADEVAHFCLASPLRGVNAAVARRLGIAAEAVIDNLAMECGDTGAPHPLVMLAAALERAEPGDHILVLGFGTGCDALLLQATEKMSEYRSPATLAATLADGRPDTHYLRLLSFSDQISLDWGMRSETDSKTALTQHYRASGQVNSFLGGKCSECGAVQFPVLATCVNCGSMEAMSPAPLADEAAKVATYTADWLMYSPSPPLYFGLVQFDNGARILMEMVDVDPTALGVGTPLRMVFRIKEKDKLRHYNRYFWKAAPLPTLKD